MCIVPLFCEVDDFIKDYQKYKASQQQTDNFIRF